MYGVTHVIVVDGHSKFVVAAKCNGDKKQQSDLFRSL